MVFKNTPATFDGIIFTIVGRIASQYDFKVIFISKVDHALHELCSMTGVLWTVIQIDDSLSDMTILFFVIIPPLFKAIDNEITGFE